MKIKTWDITGFGGGYESTCQKMLWNAVRFMRENLITELESKQYQNIAGIADNSDDPNGKVFDDAMMEGIDDATGAMHQCATNHARYIAKNGYQMWFEVLGIARKEENENEQPYEFEYEYEFSLY